MTAAGPTADDARSYLLKAAVTLDRLGGDLPPPAFSRARGHLDQRASALLGPTRCDPDEKRIANHLGTRRQWLFTFLDHPGVKATNNRAERALRPAVIARKLSCGNKTPAGKHTWEILASLAATCRQRSQDFVQHLHACLLLPAAAHRTLKTYPAGGWPPGPTMATLYMDARTSVSWAWCPVTQCNLG